MTRVRVIDDGLDQGARFAAALMTDAGAADGKTARLSRGDLQRSRRALTQAGFRWSRGRRRQEAELVHKDFPGRRFRVLSTRGRLEICDGLFDRWENSVGAGIALPLTPADAVAALTTLVAESAKAAGLPRFRLEDLEPDADGVLKVAVPAGLDVALALPNLASGGYLWESETTPEGRVQATLYTDLPHLDVVPPTQPRPIPDSFEQLLVLRRLARGDVRLTLVQKRPWMKIEEGVAARHVLRVVAGEPRRGRRRRNPGFTR